MYSDWMDPVVNDDITAGLLDMVQKTVPPPVETTEAPTSTATSTRHGSGAHPGPQGPSEPRRPARAGRQGRRRACSNEADQARIAILAALNGGPNINGAMKDDNGAPVDLNSLANRAEASATPPAASTSRAVPEAQSSRAGAGSGLQGLHGDQTGGASTGAGTVVKVVPIGNVEYTGSSMSVPVSNAEAVIRSQIHPGAKKCYQRGLESDPTQAGKLVILIKVAPSGEVDYRDSPEQQRPVGVGRRAASRRSPAARSSTLRASSGSTISVPFNFVKQGG